VYRFAQRCIYSTNQVYLFDEKIHFLAFYLVIRPIFINFATEMKELQFSIVVLMVLMCSTLILLMPEHVKRDEVYNRSRWLWW